MPPLPPGAAEQAASPLPESCDLLDVPLPGGLLALARMDRRGRPTGAVWRRGDRLLWPVPLGTAEELPGVLHWLGWGHLDGVLRATGARGADGPGGAAGALPFRRGPVPSPEPVDRLLDTCADACAQLQLRRLDQPWAFSYASRMLLGTRPRSLTS
ncbi:hypothetical protein [Streptacidiphilus neutrinimicus]|uniref:hypothetical protein n=1 Tax=Streptacidiphilus neutrinimicus TaxID=105420 RepID=UPI000693D708|nr:hypothetical protein [Streptacidiphilus neutrinimicus]